MSVSAAMEHWLWYSVRRHHLDTGLEKLRHHMRGRVLEIGNGHINRRGRFKPTVEQAEAWVYLDVETNRQPDIRGDIQHLPFADAAFDTVICLEVMEYVADPQTALSEIRRVLKGKSMLILSTPFLHRADTDHDFWRFTAHGLRYLLEQTGFEVVCLKNQGAALGVAANILKYAIYIRPRGWCRFCLAVLAWPLISLLRWRDASSAVRHPLLATFSTGYLALAAVADTVDEA